VTGGYRFLICGDGTSENAVFVTYGPKLAQLLGLPERAVAARPFVEQIPESYRSQRPPRRRRPGTLRFAGAPRPSLLPPMTQKVQI
jgi:hypothetical protein